MHDSTHFLVMDGVVKLMRIQLLGFEGDRMSVLSEDTANDFGFFGGVRGYFEFVIRVVDKVRWLEHS
jgi:hypothetical protein